jgi:phosphopantothenoylcysteine decarboxylase/phosphopantothenate--cysteine ligase
LVVIASGSIAACNVTGLVDGLRARCRAPVVVVLTCKAQRFVTKDTIQFAGGAAAVVDDGSSPLFHQPDHIWLATHARGILVYSGRADFIAKLAAGLAVDVASATFLACHERLRMVVPSMNPLMWSNPMVQRNLECLRAFGVKISATAQGVAPEVHTIVELFSSLLATTQNLGG